MNKILYILLGIIGLLGMTSCSEETASSNEYVNWQARNDTYFEQTYQQYKDSAAKDPVNWKVIKALSKDQSTEGSHTDYILVHVIKQGSSTLSPCTTDSVRVHYRGNLITSDSYADGYQFDSSWYGDYDEKTMTPARDLVSGYIDGFSTALQYMHTGDRWYVIIPYNLGYGASDKGSIPAYSTLRFDLTLHSFARAGHSLPTQQ